MASLGIATRSAFRYRPRLSLLAKVESHGLGREIVEGGGERKVKAFGQSFGLAKLLDVQRHLQFAAVTRQPASVVVDALPASNVGRIGTVLVGTDVGDVVVTSLRNLAVGGRSGVECINDFGLF